MGLGLKKKYKMMLTSIVLWYHVGRARVKRFDQWLRLIKEEENFDSNKHDGVNGKQEEQGNWVNGLCFKVFFSPGLVARKMQEK